MAVAVGEAVDLVLDRRAIARPARTDRPGEQRRAVEIGANDVVAARIGAGNRAEKLRIDPAACPSADMRQASLSDGCSASRAQSIVRPSSRGGVPVLSRAIGSEASRSWLASTCAEASPIRPPSSAPRRETAFHRGTCRCTAPRPRRTERRRRSEPDAADPPARPAQAPPPRPRSASDRPAARISRCTAALNSLRSAWTRGPCTALPFERLSMR